MSSVAFIPIVLGLIALIAAFGIYRAVLRYAPGTGKVTEIGALIHKGALVFIRREYTYLAVFVAVVAVQSWISALGWRSMVACLVGAACSALA